MNNYYNLEKSILSCLLQKPELMNQLILEDKHFIRTQRMWRFMKAFYKMFGTFDINLMYSVCNDKWQIVEYMEMLLELDPFIYNFDKYQKQLLKLYEESKKDKYIIEKVYELANSLLVRNISTSDFRNKVDEIYLQADEIFKKEENNE